MTPPNYKTVAKEIFTQKQQLLTVSWSMLSMPDILIRPHIIDKISIKIRLPWLKATYKLQQSKTKIFLTFDIQ